MKPNLTGFGFWATFAVLCFLLATSAACPDNEVMCLAAGPDDEASGQVVEGTAVDEPQASGAWSDSETVSLSALGSATARSSRR